jgi:hypothetical protein
MAGLSPGLVKAFKAEAAVTKRRIVKFGAADTAVLLGAASTDLSIGVSTEIDSAIGEPCDVIMSGIAEVEYGGTIARGAKVTSDATGKAVAAAPGAGVNAQVIGFATVSGVAGDIGSVMVSPSVMQG